MRSLLPALLAGSALVAPGPAFAQSQEVAELQQQIAAMQAEIARLAGKVEELQAKEQARDAAEAEPAAQALAPAAAPAPASTPAPAPDAPRISWKGAPEVSAPGGWSFKPRGRLQIDSATINAPASVEAGNSLGFATEFRRAFLGVEGSLPGNFGYRMEVDVATSAIELTDVFLTYKPTDKLTLTVGQHKPFWGLEELTSDLFTSMLERAAFNSAFNFERRVGLSGVYANKDLLVQLGAFTGNAKDLNSDSNNSYSFDGRVVYAPEIGEGRLHIGGSAHFRDLNDAATSVRYRARPFFHTTDVRLVDTGNIPATGERSFGAELAYVQGPFHATIEGHQITTLRPGLSNPTFQGGYAELGMIVTGDNTTYRGGAYDRIRPENPVSKGGIGAVQLNVRYDRIDLNDEDIVGGLQQAAGLSAIWIPEDYVRFILNYGHLWVSDAAVPAGTDPNYQVDTFGMRAQFDF
ncbi:MAG: porin [Porphyrobacter sp.]|nr:porin [Porphyrobacter sp.]